MTVPGTGLAVGAHIPGPVAEQPATWGLSALPRTAGPANVRDMSSARRLTGVVGRWSAGHPWTAIAAWLGIVVVLMVTGRLAGTIQLPYGAQNVGQSGQAEQMISRDFPRHAVEDVLFDSPSLRTGDPAYQAAIRDVVNRIQATGRVTQVQSPLDPRFANQVSATGHAALLQFRITGSVSDSAATVVPV